MNLFIPPELEPIQPELRRFFEAMIYKLRRNAHKGKWADMTVKAALGRLAQETEELMGAIREQNSVEMVLEAADVANFAMIIAAIAVEKGAEDVDSETVGEGSGGRVPLGDSSGSTPPVGGGTQLLDSAVDAPSPRAFPYPGCRSDFGMRNGGFTPRHGRSGDGGHADAPEKEYTEARIGLRGRVLSLEDARNQAERRDTVEGGEGS